MIRTILSAGLCVFAQLSVAQTLSPAAAPGADAARASRLEPLSSGDLIRGWQGVGKLVLGDVGFCTAVLIDKDLLVTAAHCLFHPETKARYPLHSLRFEAGLRSGRAEASRAITDAAIDPDYLYTGGDTLERVGHDIALLALERPIALPQILPFAIGAAPGVGMRVDVVSYGQGRQMLPAIERGCQVTVADPARQILDCDIDFGASGAPVFLAASAGKAGAGAGLAGPNAAPQVVAIISAKAQQGGRKVALAAALAPALPRLRQILDQQRRLHGGTGTETGAKFLRP